MTGTKGLRNAGGSRKQAHPSEAEITKLLLEAAQQYEECMRLADLADIADQNELLHPRYGWDNPIGLVVTERSNAQLV